MKNNGTVSALFPENGVTPKAEGNLPILEKVAPPNSTDKMYEFISDTASYGDLVSGPRILDEGVKDRMRDVLKDIQDGGFARQWIAEHKDGSVNYKAMLKERREHQIETTGRKLRDRMSWISKPRKAEAA